MNCCAKGRIGVDPENEEDQGAERNSEEKGRGESTKTSWEAVQQFLNSWWEWIAFCFVLFGWWWIGCALHKAEAWGDTLKPRTTHARGVRGLSGPGCLSFFLESPRPSPVLPKCFLYEWMRAEESHTYYLVQFCLFVPRGPFTSYHSPHSSNQSFDSWCHQFVLPVFGPSYKWNHIVCCFCAWLHLCNTMFVGFSHTILYNC